MVDIMLCMIATPCLSAAFWSTTQKQSQHKSELWERALSSNPSWIPASVKAKCQRFLLTRVTVAKGAFQNVQITRGLDNWEGHQRKLSLQLNEVGELWQIRRMEAQI